MIVVFGDNTSNWYTILQLGACVVDGTCQTSWRISVVKELFNAEPNHNVSLCNMDVKVISVNMIFNMY